MEPSARDTGYTPDRWSFDEEVTRVFDDMLARSIPAYFDMRSLVSDVATSYVRHGTAVVDLGCSRGEALARIRDLTPDLDLSFLGVEISEPMISAARDRFADDPDVQIGLHDLRRGYPAIPTYPPRPVSVSLSVLTLMFTPINARPALLSQAFDRTVSGGAFILVEKVIGETGGTDDLFNAYYHRFKAESYGSEEIERKRLALEGVLVPLTARWNEDLLRRAGFQTVECFWAWMNFRAWVGVKS